MTDRSANSLGFVGAVERITIAQIQAVSAQNTTVFSLVRAERRDDDIASRNQLTFISGLYWSETTVGRSLHYV